jgi:nicotinate phosphoribosyltransferase
MVSVENDKHEMVDTIKLSNNAEKVSTPGRKQVWRITEKEDGKSEGDYVTLFEENPNDKKMLYMFHPQYTYINKSLSNFNARPLLKTIFENGKQVYDMPTLAEIKQHSTHALSSLWPEYKRELNPQEYPVDLSTKCWNNKMQIIKKVHENIKNKHL